MRDFGPGERLRARRSPAANRVRGLGRLTPARQPCPPSAAITSELALKERGACNLVDTGTA